MTETEWTRKIVNEMRRCNAMVFAIVAQVMQEPGWPDRYVAHRRWAGWIEFKGQRTTLSDKQRIVIRELMARDVPAVVVRFPNRIEDHQGWLYAEFDGTGIGLLKTLEELWNPKAQ